MLSSGFIIKLLRIQAINLQAGVLNVIPPEKEKNDFLPFLHNPYCIIMMGVFDGHTTYVCIYEARSSQVDDQQKVQSV